MKNKAVDDDAFKCLLIRNPERTLRGLASMVGLEKAGLKLDRRRLINAACSANQQPNHAPLHVSVAPRT